MPVECLSANLLCLDRHIIRATPDRLTNGLVSGDIDVVVGRLTPRTDATDLRQVALYHEPFRIVARAGHPVFDLDHTSLPVLRGYPWVMPVAQTALRGELERAFAREHLDLPEQQVDCSSPLALRTIVAETDFLAVQPYTIAVADPLLHIVDVRLKGIGQTVGVTTLPDRPPSPSAALLLRCFEEVATDIRKSIGATTGTGTGQAMPAGAAMP